MVGGVAAVCGVSCAAAAVQSGCVCFLVVVSMSAIKALNPKAEVARAQAALAVNISAARGLQDVLRTNLGPKGTMKM